MVAHTRALPDDAALARQAARLGDTLRRRGWTLGTAESCTGGWIARCLTDGAGASDWFPGGVVTYSNGLKKAWLGVPESVLASDGAVSEATVRAMAAGARGFIGVDCAIAVTGVAGPGGGSDAKPVGTVWIAWATPDVAGLHDDGVVEAVRFQFDGDRGAVRRASVAAALEGMEQRLGTV